jgi:hypothetical protein
MFMGNPPLVPSNRCSSDNHKRLSLPPPLNKDRENMFVVMIAVDSVADVLILGNAFERATWGLLVVFWNSQLVCWSFGIENLFGGL